MSKLDFDFFEFLLPEVTKKIFEFGIVSQLHLEVAINKMKTARGLPKMCEALRVRAIFAATEVNMLRRESGFLESLLFCEFSLSSAVYHFLKNFAY